ncbi:hypothetical protein F5884DRAFT_249797 [Xylogone sp. PMI_703]|nr:hypothetical protein F5884DRAFT_249797 [Xylogone sp. PMI_703]
MVQVKKYQLPPTVLIPNSPRPLLHYPQFLSSDTNNIATEVYDLLIKNGWDPQWLYRYGKTQISHYHSAAHEFMVVLSGTATIRFGVADTVPDLEESTYGSGKEEGGVEIQAQPGDVFIIPAGVAHKTFDTSPVAEFSLLTPGDGHHIQSDDAKATLASIALDGFTMLGAYPKDSLGWDFSKGGENAGDYGKVWSIPKPENDPVLGKASEGLCGQW